MPEIDDDKDALPKPTEPAPPPHATSSAPGLNDLQIGAMLGELRADVRAVREQGARTEAQNVQLLDQGNTFARELQKLGTDIVDLRAEFKRHVDDPHAHAPGAGFRAPAPSITSEVKATHDSIRAVADTTAQVASATNAVAMETAKQTPMIQQSIDAAMASAKVANGTSKDQKLIALAIFATALIGLITQLLKH